MYVYALFELALVVQEFMYRNNIEVMQKLSTFQQSFPLLSAVETIEIAVVEGS